jgi:hypothetical protein
MSQSQGSLQFPTWQDSEEHKSHRSTDNELYSESEQFSPLSAAAGAEPAAKSSSSSAVVAAPAAASPAASPAAASAASPAASPAAASPASPAAASAASPAAASAASPAAASASPAAIFSPLSQDGQYTQTFEKEKAILEKLPDIYELNQHDDDGFNSKIENDSSLKNAATHITTIIDPTNTIYTEEKDLNSTAAEAVETLYESIKKQSTDFSSNSEFSQSLLYWADQFDVRTITATDSARTNEAINKTFKKVGTAGCSGEQLRKLVTAYSETNLRGNQSYYDSQGEQFQMASLWGGVLTEYSKGWNCYLCGNKICTPQMEHKKPATTVFTQYPHYFTLKRQCFTTIDDKLTDSVWWLWTEFVENDNYNLMKELYDVINTTSSFNKTEVNNKFTKVFGLFKDKIQIVYDNKISFTNDNGNINTFEYSKALLTFWLFEFAYACAECNTKKSGHDLNIKGYINNKNPELAKTGRVYVKFLIKSNTGRLENMKDRLETYVKEHFADFEEKANGVYEKYCLISQIGDDENVKDISKDIKLLQLMKSIWRMTRYSKRLKEKRLATSSSRGIFSVEVPITAAEELPGALSSANAEAIRSRKRRLPSRFTGGKGTRKKRRTKKRGVRRCNKTQRHRKTKKK